MKKGILLVGAFDTKAEEYQLIKNHIEKHGFNVITMNWGVLGSTDLFKVDIENSAVAEAGGESIESLQESGDRKHAIDVMTVGAGVLAAQLTDKDLLQGALGIGKARGTRVAAAAMRELPIGIPKVIVSTVAAQDTSAFLGTKDILMYPALADVSGMNFITRTVFAQAAAAVCGMASLEPAVSAADKKVIALTMFGQTQPCVEACRSILNDKGFETVVFHATGIGGKTMEALIRDGKIHGVIDITTTELADELCGGVFSAGQLRLEAAAEKGIPQVIVPGCMDMVNFGSVDSIPEKYRNRLMYESKPTVTLMRTDKEENRELGKILAQKASASPLTTILLPLKGLSRFGAENGRFWDREADTALFRAIHKHAKNIEITDYDLHINDKEFATNAVDALLALIKTE